MAEQFDALRIADDMVKRARSFKNHEITTTMNPGRNQAR